MRSTRDAVSHVSSAVDGLIDVEANFRYPMYWRPLCYLVTLLHAVNMAFVPGRLSLLVDDES
jgi:hypothetical protein